MCKDEKERVISNIKTTMAVENYYLDEEDIKLLEDFADDKISLEQAIILIKNMVLRKV